MRTIQEMRADAEADCETAEGASSWGATWIAGVENEGIGRILVADRDPDPCEEIGSIWTESDARHITRNHPEHVKQRTADVIALAALCDRLAAALRHEIDHSVDGVGEDAEGALAAFDAMRGVGDASGAWLPTPTRGTP